MNRSSGYREKGDGSKTGRRRLDKKEDEIIPIPEFDYSDLIDKYKLSLVGRMFHIYGRSVDALIKHMPKRHIWDVEGKVRGTNLGNNKFQFDFDCEQDLQKVLQRRPCHFNKWSFSLERWTPTIREDFPNSMLFWVVVSGVDVDGGRVRVYVNADEPLQFERRAGFANGDVIRVTLKYEDLHALIAFTCKRISHEEGTCPELSETQKEKNRLARIEQKKKEDKATREVFSFPSRYRHESVRSPDRNCLHVKQYGRNAPRDLQGAYARRGERSPQDLRDRITGHREAESKNAWNRLDKNSVSNDPRDRARYHPYHRGKEYDYSKREDEQSRSRVLSGHSNWNNNDKMIQHSVHPRDSQSVSRYSSGRRISPDSQRTLIVHYVGQSDRGYNRDLPRVSTQRINREWRPVRPSQGGDRKSPGEVMESGEKEMEAERRRIEKGKKSASHRRSKLIICEPVINNNPEMVQRSTVVVTAVQPETRVHDVHNRIQGGNVDDGMGKEKEQVKSTEGAESSVQVPEEDEEYMDEEAFEKMVELYTDPEPVLDEEMLNIDDLMEEEQELERKEKERESSNKKRELQQNTERMETRGEREEDDIRGQQIKKAVGKRSPNVAVPNQPRAGSTVVGASIDRDQERTLQREGKRKKVPRSLEIKGTTASKKLALRGCASPKSKVTRQSRLNMVRPTSQFPRNEVYPSALNGKKPSVPGSVVSQKPPTNNPSYGWSSLWTARSVLGEGLQRTIGTGADTNVWEDCWIPEELARPALPVGDEIDRDLRVHHLIIHETKCWNEPLIRELIVPEDVGKILAIRPSHIGRRYGYLWKHTKSGAYTVRSGYEVVNAKRKEDLLTEVQEPSITKLKSGLALSEARSWKMAQIVHGIEDEVGAEDQREDRVTTTAAEGREPRETRCQVDVSWTQEGATMGLGFMVLEGDRKCLLGLRNCTKAPSPLHAEGEGLVWAMKAMIRQGKRTMHFETDCAQLVSVIQNSEDWPAMTSVVEEISIESLHFECFSIAYIPRGMNQRADCLAKAVRARIDPFDCICVETPVWLAHVASLLE
ncbi:hypothetical protein Bca52824_067124 [Brassica carinata]|uniref:RNase H type-1 domain-containing protein n=1 Tax=Brassica carinata TaxID=52824 RepID=A0A8X7QLG5_BRACI|nr:hypothetical protein Bca52824_067124 [Brassica carinata]